MSGNVVANQADIAKLKNELEAAASEYKANRAKLEGLVQQIVNGEFKGQPADTFKAQYEKHVPTFEGVQKEIDEAQAFIEEEEQKFVTLTNNLMDNMR